MKFLNFENLGQQIAQIKDGQGKLKNKIASKILMLNLKFLKS